MENEQRTIDAPKLVEILERRTPCDVYAFINDSNELALTIFNPVRGFDFCMKMSMDELASYTTGELESIADFILASYKEQRRLSN